MKLKVLVVGSGGRESALIEFLLRSKYVDGVFATGNGGFYPEVCLTSIDPTDFQGLIEFAKAQKIDITVCASDNLLALGIVDAFQAEGLAIFGPTMAAAEIESSKAKAKSLMWNYGIPTASFDIFDDAEEARERAKHVLRKYGAVVIKADGLALGKGVGICYTEEEVDSEIQRITSNYGHTLIVEKCLNGLEVSFHVLVDTKGSYKVFPITQDHKREFDGDKGRNTGGMGVVGPVSLVTEEQIETVRTTIIEPLIKAMAAEGAPFVGCLYPGIIFTADGPKVLEINARFGDPETQVYMPLLETDLMKVLAACVYGQLDEIEIKWKKQFTTCVAMVSEGYPGDIKSKGNKITGIEEAEKIEGVTVFLAGAKKDENGEIVNWGGRVLYVVALADTLNESILLAYAGVGKIEFEGMGFRTDIGAKVAQTA